ncbi:MAG: hypothetical protein K0U86_06110 [Planctomycetes bacterium]|nr:hypothetical protein [Planctomycetota bacterium]MCH9724461.1 hypothetical protein [Planctomycetota bacterium]MCH9778203.1 hypothetical protein [Planctomycetota bacterium]
MNGYIKKVDQFAAAPMFSCALLFLVFFAGTLHLINAESPGIALDICNWCLFLIYPLFILETVIHVALGSPRWKFNLLYCLIPPLRICARDQMTGQAIWFPMLAWKVVDSDFREKISKTFSAPMLVIALLVLPLFAVEHYWQKQIAANPALSDLTAIATGFIWFAFTLEFIVMISIVEKRLDYCRRHWIDIAVICLPMIAFMRALRVTGLLRLQQLTKTARVFRIKSLVLKLYRALLLLEIVNRLLQRNPEKRIIRLETILLEKEKEITDIKEEIAFLSERISPQPQTDSELAIQQDTQQFNNRAA